MGAYNVVNPANMVAGQPEDVSVVLANFNAIATILNGGIDNSNINAAAAILASKLAGYPADGAKLLAGDGTWVGAYQAYAPVWTSTGVAPVIGNSTVTARYVQLGKLVHCWAKIVFGNTTTFGTGNYAFSLPIATNPSDTRNFGTVDMNDNSAGARQTAIVEAIGGNIQFAYAAAWPAGAQTIVGAAAPWAWANLDFICWNILYEAV